MGTQSGNFSDDPKYMPRMQYVQMTMEDMGIIHRLGWPSTEELAFNLVKRKQID